MVGFTLIGIFCIRPVPKYGLIEEVSGFIDSCLNGLDFKYDCVELSSARTFTAVFEGPQEQKKELVSRLNEKFPSSRWVIDFLYPPN